MYGSYPYNIIAPRLLSMYKIEIMIYICMYDIFTYVRMHAYVYVYAVFYFFAATRKRLERKILSDTESDNGKIKYCS